jgi:hypothetical protein
VPLLSWLARRLRTVRELEAEADRREKRTSVTTAKAHQAIDRAARLAREMEQAGRALR